MRPFISLWLTQSFFLQSCFALLEESFVAFDASPGTVTIHNAPIIYSADDFTGVRIAAESLSSDLFEVTGAKPELLDASATNLSGIASAIIVGSINSNLIRSLSKNGTNATFEVAELEGKWETFKTQIVKHPLPGIASALVISGSDKRGTIFGIHTLAEQCGQSP